ncbi:Rieske 2Fe-2S domain-containing protein [Burkholderiaceae bacterium DAT-1]|nr:Rieske 2Fe-2S domain-containing protein [Burkholderiaceae bacterium DAT-1]
MDVSSERILICDSDALADRGAGVRFTASWAGQSVPAFVLRHNGVLKAFLNECRHVPIELDFNEGDFLDLTREYIICSTHGAMYRPVDGMCVGGPCRGKSLYPLKVIEEDGQVYYLPEKRA